MAKLKTKPNEKDVSEFLDAIEDETRQSDTRTVVSMMERLTGFPAVMWGSQIIGFDTYHYKYASGREGDWMLTGVSPRKAALTLYLMSGFSIFPEMMERLGKFKTGKSCLYIKDLGDVDMKVLEELVAASIADMRQRYPR